MASAWRSTARQIEGYNQKIAALQAQLGQAQADIQGYQMRLQLAVAARGHPRQAREDAGGQRDRPDRRAGPADRDGTAARQLGRDRAAVAGNIKEMVQERETFDKQWFAQISGNLTDAQKGLNEAQQNLNKAQLRRQIVEMKAPVDAIVLSVTKGSVGSVVQAGGELMDLTPLDSPMEIDTMVAGQDAGWVHPGQSALIQFNAFLYTRYGTASGTVRYQSADSFTTINTPTQVGATLMQSGSPTLPYYDTRITVDQINLHGIPGGFHMRPGMPVQVQIATGSRTLLQYILQRVLTVPNEGMREPT